jgi:transcriptional regulator with PAS, ATPase and Fis domain
LPSAPQNSWPDHGLIARSEAFKKVLALGRQVARHPAAVLIVGETGTGKEMIARSIHEHSLRCNNAWIDVNCAAIPEHLVESELFGYEKGAFSGADEMKPGLFELADKGTLLLDEIGDLDMKVQVKLLRVLDGVSYYRLGGSRKISVDVRVVASTNQNLEELVQAGRFRRDLYHRLAQFKLEIPPLRERPEDLIGIAEQLLRLHHPNSVFSNDAIASLLNHPWPGNVRELKNAVFRAVLCAQNPQARITAEDLGIPQRDPEKQEPTSTGDHPIAVHGDLNQVERQMIFHALEKFAGNQGKAAQALGISRRTLLRKLKSYRENNRETGPETFITEEDRHHRAQMDIPITLKYRGEDLDAALINISIGGAAFFIEKQLNFGMPAGIRFTFPDSRIEAEISGRIAWSNGSGQHGIEFISMSEDAGASLRDWINSQVKKEKIRL